MKKSKLLSLLAIPIFSLATTVNSFNATVFNSYQESKKIKATTVAGGVLDFLLGSQKISGKMNPDQKLALGILSDFLKLQGQRQHERDLAIDGRSQLTINTTDGRQAQLFNDKDGNIYLLRDGIIHPVSQEFVNQARDISTRNILGIENATLPQYNLRGLESMFNSNPKEDVSQNYRVQKGGEYLSDIAKKFEVPPSNIFYWADPGGPIWSAKSELRHISERKKVWENKKKIKRSAWGGLVIAKEKHKNQISAIFSYGWHQDFNNDSALDFNEFNQIRKTFYNDEDFNIGVKYQTEKGFKGNLVIKILEDNTGKLLVNEKTEILSNGLMVGQQYIPAGSLPEGTYLFYANLTSKKRELYQVDEKTNTIREYLKTISSKSEKFEIVQRK